MGTIDLHNKRIGIWGLGIVGKSAVRYVQNHTTNISVMDSRALQDDEILFLKQHNASFFRQDDIEQFFNAHDYVVISPGIDYSAYMKYSHKCISELDLFAAAYKKPIIAVTGSVGKTSIVHLLGKILQKKINVGLGGNIEIGMLDLIENQDKHDAAVLELSSFQLEQSHTFSPDIALWTNFFPNHLDRHGSEESYFKAKQKIINNQHAGQHALLPLSLLEKLLPKRTNGQWYAMSCKPPAGNKKQLYQSIEGFFYSKDGNIVFEKNGFTHDLIALEKLPSISFIENWIAICATLYLLGIPLSILEKCDQLCLPEHRLEKVAEINGVTFYNDSKSTTIASTKAAIAVLKSKPIILLLGGISKGVDRTELIQQMDCNVKLIICFGKERDDLSKKCHTFDKPCISFSTLEQACLCSIKRAAPGDQVLFSPSGASFDLFANYKERGNHFKKIVTELLTLAPFEKDGKI